MGALAVAAMPAAAAALRRTPLPATRSSMPDRGVGWSPRPLLPLFASYAFFGLGYIAYTTFIVAWLRSGLAFGTRDVVLFWACLGLTAGFAGLAWGLVLARMRGGGVALANAAATAGVVLPVLGGTGAAYASAVLFGSSFLIVPTAVTAFARKATPPSAWTETIAALTFVFALGQCLGPIAGGWVSDSGYGLRGGLALSAALLALAALIALLQREPGETTRVEMV
jgi:hypothetical protein